MDASTREHTRDDARDRETKPARFGRSHRRMWLVGAFIVLGLTIGAGGIAWWLQARQFESTDDAFIDSRVVSISPQVSGAIVNVAVTDNELLDEGAKLVSIDDRDYRAALEQADAQVDQAEATISNIDAQIEAQRAKIDQAENEVVETQGALTFAQQENDRYQQLLRTGAGTAQRAQQAQSELRQRQAAFDAAKANAIATTKQISVLQSQRAVAAAQLRQARATRDQAKANLDRTSVLAPVRGRVTKLTAAKGAYAQVGQSLLMFVPTEIWVTANFKETQLTYMRPGQSVTIAIDAYPHRTFHGHVDSIQAGSGAAFSLLPPENATGNYVKVVQRVPVKIAFDQPPDVLLGPGMSVVPTIKVR